MGPIARVECLLWPFMTEGIRTFNRDTSLVAKVTPASG